MFEGRFDDESTCGRPLGMQFDHESFLIVIETYLGLSKVNVDTGHVTKLYSSSKEVSGKRPMLLNDLDIASHGSIYISDSSTTWDHRHITVWPYNRPEAGGTGVYGTLGLYSLSGKTSYHTISLRLEAARFGFKLFQTLWNLTGTSAAALPRCLSIFRAILSL